MCRCQVLSLTKMYCWKTTSLNRVLSVLQMHWWHLERYCTITCYRVQTFVFAHVFWIAKIWNLPLYYKYRKKLREHHTTKQMRQNLRIHILKRKKEKKRKEKWCYGPCRLQACFEHGYIRLQEQCAKGCQESGKLEQEMWVGYNERNIQTERRCLEATIKATHGKHY